MLKKILQYVFLTLFLFGCGYKVVNYSEINNFDVASIETTGNKRINYKIKNKLLFNSSKNNKRLIKINLETTKEKKLRKKTLEMKLQNTKSILK